MLSSSKLVLFSFQENPQKFITPRSIFPDSQFSFRHRKFLKDIYLLQAENSHKAKNESPNQEFQKVLSKSPKPKEPLASILLPPLPVSNRDSINSSLSLTPMPMLHQNESTPIFKKKTIKFDKLQGRRSTLAYYPPVTIKNSVIRCSCKSRIGSVMDISKPQNQDNFIITSNLKSLRGQYLFAVCDGHGEDGHEVSSLIKKKFPKILLRNLPENPSGNKEIYYEAIRKSYSEINNLVMNGNFDSEYSGSTFVSVLIVGNHVFCANVGDSRAVLGRFNETWQAIDLSNDQKPNRKDESVRIIEKGGRIEANGTSDLLRIWKACENSPGLAMTRSIGDAVAKEIGVICEPEIIDLRLLSTDKFIIIASDGVWDYINSLESVQIVSKAWKKGKSELCCETLLDEAVKRWRNNTESIDDITILVIFLRAKTL
ncbi:hypothetical protein SteCoe_22302 [Stentor coeruleus]|uniref:PPM-type phosphatase domain-containing protein n=1 Tax=Stentor coeruleus TaxID=5963 RepID=A0A1R2BMJ9_9CILI|nr:hypothetical protein SteCoe_22302 [Stentor coeruleus]